MQPTFNMLSTRADAIAVVEDGLLEGAVVLTLEGEMPVEHLAPGDRIVTRRGGMARLVSIEPRETTKPAIIVPAGIFGNGRPAGETLVAADTLVNIRDWRARALFGCREVAVPITRLVTEGEARRLRTKRRHFSLRFAREEILYVDGLEIAAPLA